MPNWCPCYGSNNLDCFLFKDGERRVFIRSIQPCVRLRGNRTANWASMLTWVVITWRCPWGQKETFRHEDWLRRPESSGDSNYSASTPRTSLKPWRDILGVNCEKKVGHDNKRPLRFVHFHCNWIAISSILNRHELKIGRMTLTQCLIVMRLRGINKYA